jgi:hypothetical protein
MQNSFLLSCLLFLLCFSSKAQTGGDHIFSFLTTSNSARETALGENLITVLDDDVALAYANPSLANALMHHQLTFNHNFHFTGIENGYFGYGHSLKKWNIDLHTGMKYVQYGEFIGTDNKGNETGNFKANEWAYIIGAGRQMNERIRVGLNLKYIYSHFEAYNSSGIAADLAVNYINPEKFFTATAVIRNWGTQLTSYNGHQESLPFDIQAGISKRLEHLPFRFSIIAHHLHQWNILYDDPNEETGSVFFEEPNDPSNFSVFADNLFRHVLFNGEFLLGKKGNFRLRAGYNHLRRQELRVSNFRGMGGFSGGVGIKINRFRFDYGFGTWHLAGSNHHISFSTNLNEFRKKI